MTVAQLIEQLKYMDQTLPVVISYTDHTDWTYKMELDEHNITVGNVIQDGGWGENHKWDDDDGDTKVCELQFSEFED